MLTTETLPLDVSSLLQLNPFQHERTQFRLPQQDHRAFARYEEGLQLREEGRREEAAALFAEAASLAPSNPNYHLVLGQLLYELGRSEEAAECFDQLTRLVPTNPSFWLTLGYIRFQLEKFQDAILPLSEAVCLDPASPEGTLYLAEALRLVERFEESIPLYQKLLAVGTRMPHAVYGYALSLLAVGRYDEGWDAFEFRRLCKLGTWDRHLYENWDGIADKKRSILAYSEEGISADLLFASCLSELIDSVGKCTVECDELLHPLFARSFPNAKFIPLVREPIQPPQEGAPPFDAQIALGSLPRYFRKQSTAFPRRDAYLLADPWEKAIWKRRLAEGKAGKKVGILWKGSWGPEKDAQRTLSESSLRFLLETGSRAAFDWVCLQPGSARKDLTSIRSQWKIELREYPDVFHSGNLDSLAALISALDLVITPPGYVANLAGALGVPTWLLLPNASDWRWMLQENGKSLWFPKMRLFRERPDHSWKEVLQEVRAAMNQ